MAKKKKRDGQEFFPLGKGLILKKVLTIDPGMWRTGLAYWREISGAREVDHPTTTRLLQADKRLHWNLRSNEIIGQLNAFVSKNSIPDIVIIEMPGLWMDSEVSMAAAAKGDLFKLTVLIGRIQETISFYREPGPQFFHVSPQMWKGQLSKKLVKKRIDWALHQEFPDDVEDAVGMGLAVQGLLG